MALFGTNLLFSQDVSTKGGQAQQNSSISTGTANIDSGNKNQQSSVNSSTIVPQTSGDYKDRKKINITVPDGAIIINPK